MSNSLTRSKFFSGKYVLCCATGICLVFLTSAVCAVLVWGDINAEKAPLVAAVIGVLSTILTGIVTNYFTKKSPAKREDD